MRTRTLTKVVNTTTKKDAHRVDFKIPQREKTEKELEEKLKTEIKNRNGNCLKWEGSPGAPDRIVF